MKAMAAALVLAGLVIALAACESIGFHAEGSPDDVDWGISIDI